MDEERRDEAKRVIVGLSQINMLTNLLDWMDAVQQLAVMPRYARLEQVALILTNIDVIAEVLAADQEFWSTHISKQVGMLKEAVESARTIGVNPYRMLIIQLLERHMLVNLIPTWERP